MKRKVLSIMLAFSIIFSNIGINGEVLAKTKNKKNKVNITKQINKKKKNKNKNKKEEKKKKSEKNIVREKVKKENLLEVTIEKVIDGDSFVIKNKDKEIKLRLIGVDTPESVHPKKEKNTKEGKIASDYVKNLLKKGDKVYLEYDVSKYDKYNRELVYLYYENENKELEMLNEHLLKIGYATVLTIQPNVKYSDFFYDLQVEAREKELGFWKIK